MTTNYSILKSCILELFTDIEDSISLTGNVGQSFYACKSFIQKYKDDRVYFVTNLLFISMRKEIETRDPKLFTENYYREHIKKQNFTVVKYKAGKMFMRTLSKIFELADNDNKNAIWKHIEVIAKILFKGQEIKEQK